MGTIPVTFTIYVAQVWYGEHEETCTKNIYVGYFHSKAKDAIMKFQVPKTYSQNSLVGFIEYWKNGENIKDEYIIEQK
jgi:hypothetical protein